MATHHIASSATLNLAEERFRIDCLTSLDQIDPGLWDALAPRDAPHLRYGFLRAVEDSGFGRNPRYLCAWRKNRLAGAAVAYSFPLDLLTLAPPKYTRWIGRIRSWIAPNMLRLSSINCGPIITNCNHNFLFSDELTAAEQLDLADSLIREIEKISGASVISMFEFPEEAANFFAPVMEARGYLKAPSLPGTRMTVRWRSLDEYVAQMRKAFRRTVVKDRRAAEGIDFEIVDDFSDLAEEACKLYRNVLAKADHVFEELTPEFFRELAKFEQSRLLAARDRATGELIGIELLLQGETTLQDLYTGLDYRYNPDHRLYFNLLYPVIGYAGEAGFKTLQVGQTSYRFKARLGAQAYPLFIFVKHRNRLIHRLLVSLKGVIFPESETTTFHVFRDDPAVAEAKPVGISPESRER